MLPHSISYHVQLQPENMSLKDYGRLINDGEVKLKAHSDHKNKSRLDC